MTFLLSSNHTPATNKLAFMKNHLIAHLCRPGTNLAAIAREVGCSSQFLGMVARGKKPLPDSLALKIAHHIAPAVMGPYLVRVVNDTLTVERGGEAVVVKTVEDLVAISNNL